jgi:hypothetical protein
VYLFVRLVCIKNKYSEFVNKRDKFLLNKTSQYACAAHILKFMAAPKTPMTKTHKASLAIGRAESRTVRDYLEAVRRNRPKRGRKRTPDSIKKRLAVIENQFDDSDAITQLKSSQERLDLSMELAEMTRTQQIGPLEKAFVKVARSYGDRNGITYTAWREIGVDPAILKKAGITR